MSGCVHAPPEAKAADEESRVSVAIERPRATRGLTVKPYIGANPNVVYESFWDATANLDLAAADTMADDNDQRRFSAAMYAMLDGNLNTAEQLFDSLGRHTKNAFVATASRVMLTAALQYQDKWDRLANLSPDTMGIVRAPLQKNADVEVWARAFAKVGDRIVYIPAREQIVPLTVSRVGTPVIPVQINGKDFLFWLDTGASMSIVSSDVARAAGVTALGSDTLSVATAAGQVAAVPAVISSIGIGQIRITNATAMIVDESLMRVRDSIGTSKAGSLKIDGIIGWDTIREMDLTINFGDGIATVRKPVRKATPHGSWTLFWAGVPIVRLQSGLGRTVHFALDTGAQETFATQWLLEKAFVPVVTVQRKRIGGMGEDLSYVAQQIPQVVFDLPGQTLVLRKMLVYAPAFWTFVHLDGVLGSDVARAGVMRIDATNHLFALSRS
jgi:clan AA aspartic protease (TIGR02281 family)